MIKRSTTLGIAVACLLVISPAKAGLLPVLNNGFELPPLTDGTDNEASNGDTSGGPASRTPNWEIAQFGGGAAAANLLDADSPQSMGENWAYAYGGSGSAGNGARLIQTLTGQILKPLNTYTLSVLVGDIKGGTVPARWPFADVSLTLFAGATQLAQTLIGSQVGAVDAGPGDGLSKYYSVVYTAPASPPAGDLRIVLQSNYKTGDDTLSLALFDDVTLTAVPEPATISLLTLGAICFGMARRRGRKIA